MADPTKYRRNRPRPIAERFWEKVLPANVDACWIWQSTLTEDGYGRFYLRPGRKVMAHRHSWESFFGPIPDGLFLDHLCRQRRCVNPYHLDVVTNLVNAQRGKAGINFSARTHCSRGHEYNEENTYYKPSGKRICRACGRIYNQKQTAKKK